MDIKSKRNKRPREIDSQSNAYGYGGETMHPGPPSTAKRGSSMSSLPPNPGFRDGGGGHTPGLSPAAAAAASLQELSHLKFGGGPSQLSVDGNNRNPQVRQPPPHSPPFTLSFLSSPPLPPLFSPDQHRPLIRP